MFGKNGSVGILYKSLVTLPQNGTHCCPSTTTKSSLSILRDVHTSSSHSFVLQLPTCICQEKCTKLPGCMIFGTWGTGSENDWLGLCCHCNTYLLFSLLQELLESFILPHTWRKLRLPSCFHLFKLLPEITQSLQFIIQATLSCPRSMEIQLQVKRGADRMLLGCPSHIRLASQLQFSGISRNKNRVTMRD